MLMMLMMVPGGTCMPQPMLEAAARAHQYLLSPYIAPAKMSSLSNPDVLMVFIGTTTPDLMDCRRVLTVCDVPSIVPASILASVAYLPIAITILRGRG